MAEFLSRPLGMLERIFRFRGAKKSISQLDLENPASLVVDLSRYAQSGHGQYQGLYRYTGTVSNAGAATAQATIGTAQILIDLGLMESGAPAGPGAGGPLQEYWVWLMEVGVRVSNSGTCGNGTIGIGGSATAPYRVLGTGAETDQYLRYLTGTSLASTATGAGTVNVFMQSTYVPGGEIPRLLYPGDTLTFRFTSTGACDYYWGAWLWVGPGGSGPPGFA